MFPSHVELDMIDKSMYYKCVPMLPYLDINRVLASTKNIKLLKKEKVRNDVLEDFVY